MAKKSGFLQKQEARSQAWASAAERITLQIMTDTAQITLHRMGWGYERIERFNDEWVAAYKHYKGCLAKGPEQDVYQEHLDRELQDIMKGHLEDFMPFDERYPELKKVTY